MIAKLRSGDSEAKAARILLARYIPDGPGAAADAGAWESWIQQNSPYMFFSEMGGLRWYIDPLALKRHIPTARLRWGARSMRKLATR